MSIQILVASPYYYFSEWMDNPNPKKSTENFASTLKDNFGIDIINPFAQEEFFSEDLPSGESVDLSIFAYGISQKIQWQIGADLYLPYEFEGTKKVSISCLDDESELMVCSTSEFAKAVQIIEDKIDAENNTETSFREIFPLYKEAISISNKVKQPIFWSY